MVQLPAVFPVGARRLSASSPRRLGRGRSLHPARIRYPRRMPHPCPRTFGLQVRLARLAPAAQRHHLAVAQHDVLQSSMKQTIHAPIYERNECSLYSS